MWAEIFNKQTAPKNERANDKHEEKIIRTYRKSYMLVTRKVSHSKREGLGASRLALGIFGFRT